MGFGATVDPRARAAAAMRAALDTALQEGSRFSMLDPDGHVELVDSDIDTGSISDHILEQLLEAGWTLSWRERG